MGHDQFGYLKYTLFDLEALLSAHLVYCDILSFEASVLLLWKHCVLPLVTLIDEAEYSSGLLILPTLLEPMAEDIIEGLGIGGIAYENDCMRAFVVGLGDSSESFLPSGIPELYLDEELVDIEGSICREAYLKRKSMPMVEI